MKTRSQYLKGKHGVSRHSVRHLSESKSVCVRHSSLIGKIWTGPHTESGSHTCGTFPQQSVRGPLLHHATELSNAGISITDQPQGSSDSHQIKKGHKEPLGTVHAYRSEEDILSTKHKVAMMQLQTRYHTHTHLSLSHTLTHVHACTHTHTVCISTHTHTQTC